MTTLPVRQIAISAAALYISNIIFSLLYFWALPNLLLGTSATTNLADVFRKAVSGSYLIFPESFGLSVPLTILAIGILIFVFDGNVSYKKMALTALKTLLAALLASAITTTFTTDFGKSAQFSLLLAIGLITTLVTVLLAFAPVGFGLKLTETSNNSATQEGANLSKEASPPLPAHRRNIILTLYLGNLALGFMLGRAVPWDSAEMLPDFYAAFYYIGIFLTLLGLTIFVQLPMVHLLFIGTAVTTGWFYKTKLQRRIGILVATALSIGLNLLMNALMRPAGMEGNKIDYLMLPIEGSIALLLSGLVMLLASDFLFRNTKNSAPAHT